MMKLPAFLLSTACLMTLQALPHSTPGASAQAAPTCDTFGVCIQEVLNHPDPVDRVLYATQALQRWTPDMPERDLLNVLKLRGEALIALHLSGSAADLDPLHHAEADYQHFLEQAPGHWLPLSGLGRIAELREDNKAAEDLLNQAVRSQQPRAYAARAAFFHRQELWKKAVADFNQSLRLDEQYQKRDMGMPRLERGNLFYLRGQAYGHLKQALDERLDFESACKLGLTPACDALK